ncbi:type II secretion system F family protein [Candidatus Pacearchaeota archaeon]|nr:type II secretion system F family protein [Candidatus Pacearchaeota archaeon]
MRTIKSKHQLTRQQKTIRKRKQITSAIFSIVVAVAVLIIKKNIITSVAAFFITFVSLHFLSKFRKSMKISDRRKKIEEVFPDFLQLVASNLRAGMTVDKAMLLSSRPEFAPLDREILQTGKEISTGKPIAIALRSMATRIGSENVTKTLLIILSGIRAGGNLAVLLEDTSRIMRQRGVVEKKAASQVLMYVIFIFLAVSVFAPGLFSLSGVLVGTMTDMMGGVSPDSVPSNLPVSFSSISISVEFVYYFSLIFIISMNIMASLILGLVGKGSEKEGLRTLPVMLLISLGIFFTMSKILKVVMAGFT